MGSVRVCKKSGVEVAWVDQGYSGEEPAQAAEVAGIRLEVVKLAEFKRGFVLLPRRWVPERSHTWMARFGRIAKDYERLPARLAGLHFVAFTLLHLHRALPLLAFRAVHNITRASRRRASISEGCN